MIPPGSFARMARRARRRREEVRRAPPRLQQAVLPRPQWTGSEPAISAAGPMRRCAPARHGRTSVSTHGGDSTQVPRTEPASPYLMLQDRGAGAPEGRQMAAFPEGRRRTRSRLSRPMSQRARFDAPRRRFVRRTRATTRRPPVVRTPLWTAAIASIDAFSQSQAAGRMGASRATRRPPPAPSTPTSSHRRHGQVIQPMCAAGGIFTRPDTTSVDDETTVDEATQDRRNGVCCRSENAATSIGVGSEHRRRSGDLVYESKNDDACWFCGRRRDSRTRRDRTRRRALSHDNG